jgi:transposase
LHKPCALPNKNSSCSAPKLGLISQKSKLAEAIRYALSRWEGLTRFVDDGRIEIDSNAAERALRGVACGRKSWLFAGSDEPTSQYCST